MENKKSELQLACEKHGITISSIHKWLKEKPILMDRWDCTILYNGRSETFDYGSGIGHRKLALGVVREGLTKYYKKSTGDVIHSDKEAIKQRWLLLVSPSVADVLSGLLMETDSCYTTFDDWCSDFGYSNDSISAQQTYFDCQRNGQKLINLLGKELVDELKQKGH